MLNIGGADKTQPRGGGGGGRISVLESTVEHLSALQSLTPNQVTALVSMRIGIAGLKGHIKAGT